MDYSEIVNEIDLCVSTGQPISDELEIEGYFQDIDVYQLYQERSQLNG